MTVADSPSGVKTTPSSTPREPLRAETWAHSTETSGAPKDRTDLARQPEPGPAEHSPQLHAAVDDARNPPPSGDPSSETAAVSAKSPDSDTTWHGLSTPEGEGGDGSAKVAVHADDPITRLALVSYVRLRPDLVLTHQASEADIVIAALQKPDEPALTALKQQANDETIFVVIVEDDWLTDWHRALDMGVRAVLFRTDFDWARLNEALRHVQAGHGDLPTLLQGRLMNQVQRTYREVLAPRGLTPSGLTTREIDVLRLVADGYELQDIATKIAYSERTVKNILYGVIKRHRLRNRAHAVSYAIRCGLI